ncbi:hypothetical protein KPL74_08975 [Bacillus sp. NP157]|nr:hypothetical protein KPL74_08975 [Bacillus sp. NP157]
MNEHLVSFDAHFGERIPDISVDAPHLMVPFKARHLPQARVVWTNRRWLAQQGLNPWDAAVLAAFERWVLDSFAVASVVEGEQPEGRDVRWVDADRYGSSTGMNPHGGSGRVATIGRFQVKGIGITPLTSAAAPDDYASGAMPLEEGIREALYSEVAAQEFPGGVVPVVAVLDTGMTAPDFERRTGHVRRGLLVRPAVHRAAHVERAPMFTRAIVPGAVNHPDDALRCREMVRAWLKPHGGDANAALMDHLSLVARQLAFAQVNRLSVGGYFTSNVTLGGQCLDFGNMHAFASWSESRVLVNIPGLGREQVMVKRALGSLAHFLHRLSDTRRPVDPHKLASTFEQMHEEAISAEFRRMAGVNVPGISSRAAELVEQVLRQTFRQHQRSRAVYKFGRVAHRAGPFPGESGAGSEHESLCRTIESTWASEGIEDNASLAHIERVLRQRLRPRRDIDRRDLMDTLRELLDDEGGEISRSRVETEMQRRTSCARRVWPSLPPALSVLNHVSLEGSSLLRCSSADSQVEVLWAEGPMVGETPFFFGSPLSGLLSGRIVVCGPMWHIDTAVDDHSLAAAPLKIAEGMMP